MNTTTDYSKWGPIKRVLVTGGAGFIGSHTVAMLLEQGLQVVVLDNLSSGRMTNLDLQLPELEFIEGDVLEYPLLADLLNTCDAVLHLAAIASVPLSMANPIYTFQVNTQGFLHVLQAVQQAHRPIRFVYASSAAVYGDEHAQPCDDQSPLISKASSPYSLQKIACEQYADLYARLYNTQSLALRYFNVYGPRQDPDSPYSGVITRFLNAYKKGQALTVFGDGQQSRDFIHVYDIARANILALQSDYAGTVNIATGEAQTLLQMIRYIEEAGSRPASTHFVTAREGDIKLSYGTTQLAQQQIGFQFAIPLQEGIGMMLRS